LILLNNVPAVGCVRLVVVYRYREHGRTIVKMFQEFV